MQAITGYYKLGPDFDHTMPLTSILPRDGWTVVMNVALLVRCLVAFTLNANVFTDLWTRLGQPYLSCLEAAVGPQAAPRASWAVVSVAGLVLSFLVAWAVPFFSTLLAFVAGFGDILAPYTLPALFGLVLLRNELPLWESWLLRTLVPVSVAFATAGLVAAAMDLLSQLD